MATVAEQLRAARDAAGLSPAQVAQQTKMRVDRVEAVEAGNYEAFTAPVYIRGFVRTYARLVKADETAVMASLDAELAQTARFREPPSLTGEASGTLDRVMLRLSLVPWRLVLPVVVLVLIVLLATWIYQAIDRAHTADPLAGIEPAVYQPATDAHAELLPPPGPSR
jgi:cytoskeleton protein RodZ